MPITRNHIISPVLIFTLVASSVVGNLVVFPNQENSPILNQDSLVASYANIPLVFEPNLGQTDDSVLFLNKSGNSSTYFTVDATTCDLGNLTATATSTCTHTMSASTNAKDGYSISYIETEALTSGSNEIVETGDTGEGSIVGTKQFGFNLVANTNPVVGDNPIGGVGQVSANYSTPNVFSFNTDSAQVASSTIPSLPTTYTASFMANVSSTTPSGDYSTVVTYIMTANW